MSDIEDTFKVLKERKQEKRADNMQQSTRFITRKGIYFTSHNNGTHLVIDEPNTGVIDFWPSTGLWIPRNTGRKHRGVLKLATYILGEENEQAM